MTDLAPKIGLPEADLAQVLADPRCPPREKFKSEAKYLKRLGQLARRLGLLDALPAGRAAGRAAEKSRRSSATSSTSVDRVTRHRERKREIPTIPDIVNPDRREECSRNFRLHCETYHPETFYAPWGEDHLIVIDRIEKAVIHSGRYCVAVFRGFGKTQLCNAALVWASINAYRRFLVLIGSEKTAADSSIQSVEIELETNDRLLEDYPEICHPIRIAAGNPQRANFLSYQGTRCRLQIKLDRIRFARVGSPTDGTVIVSAGLTGRLRGMNEKLATGGVLRPDFVLLDDPQTDESARSPDQVTKRRAIINKSVLKLAGHDKNIAALMPCTVIERDDLTEKILADPVWQVHRGKMVYEWPTREDLWEKYREIRLRVLRGDPEGKEATEFYRANREAMDEGARLGWKYQWDKATEISALQHAYNLLIDDEESFFAECQNEPIIPENELSKIPSPGYLEKVRTGLARNVVPSWATILVASLDLQDNLVFYMVAAFDDNFRGGPIAYGTVPDQKRLEFRTRTAPRPLSGVYDGGPDAVILAGARDSATAILDYEFKRPNGNPVPISALVMDGGYKPESARAARRQVENNVVHVSFGRGIKADNKPMTEYRRKPGDRFGLDWYIPGKTETGEPHVFYDANSWKTRILNAWNTAEGDPGSFCIYGTSRTNHPLLTRHLLQSENYVEVQGQTRKILEWRNKSGRENHWLDTLVLCYVGASMSGARIVGQEKEEEKRKRASRSLRQMKQAAKRRSRG